MSEFSGKNVLITGATGVLGTALALDFASRGARVGVHHRGSEGSHRASQDLVARCPGARSIAFDLRDTEALTAGVEQYLTDAGGIDVLVCNAGIFRTELLALGTAEAIDETIQVNLLAPIHCARAVLPSMLRAKKGVIVMIGSVAAVRPFRAQAAYSASKAGLEGLVRSLAVEYARKRIRTFGVRAGPMASPMSAGVLALAAQEVKDKTLLGRLLQAPEVARSIVDLCGEHHTAINGTMIDLDGGYVLA